MCSLTTCQITVILSLISSMFSTTLRRGVGCSSQTSLARSSSPRGRRPYKSSKGEKRTFGVPRSQEHQVGQQLVPVPPVSLDDLQHLLPAEYPPFRPIPEDLMLQAFEVLDKQKKGHLELEELTKYMTQEGEPFTQEEMEEMLSAAMDPDKNLIFYKDFVSMMTVDDPR
uniref:EF-hand domain-containing protein n=1 Tax=Oncorhynchus tshawytscha TaxID=74940 RepID=A0AAZ3S6R4_ONCTS